MSLIPYSICFDVVFMLLFLLLLVLCLCLLLRGVFVAFVFVVRDYCFPIVDNITLFSRFLSLLGLFGFNLFSRRGAGLMNDAGDAD